jgi:cytochrome c oxidase cbb3-type subunit 1
MQVTNPTATTYNYQIVRQITVAALIWLVFALCAGLFIALELVLPGVNMDLPWTSFGRMRPVHTTAIVVAFCGNMLIGTSFYVVQRTCQARLTNPRLAFFVFVGFQLVCAFSILGYINGITQAREYAEQEWHVSLLMVVVWLSYLYIFINTLRHRKEPHIYVANWFYLASIIVIAILYVGNHISIPYSWTNPNSVYAFAGVQSAMIQWWYGHNMVGFLLTTSFIAIMYYFVPKQANRPIYSYRLSIMHFWALIFLYIWAGPHHLHYTALPDWTQTLGMTMSLMLWLPSWGGMINGIMTLSGAWNKLREDPILRFMVIAIAFYGMATFEGPVMAIKSVNALSHYTEWTISHVHSGGLGWVALISFGALYHMIPILWKCDRIYSNKLINWHLWLASIGIVLYVTSMWAAGILQGLMWRSYDEMGFLKYSFVEIVATLKPYYAIRFAGGLFFFAGVLLMVYNIWQTIRLRSQLREGGLAKVSEASI